MRRVTSTIACFLVAGAGAVTLTAPALAGVAATSAPAVRAVALSVYPNPALAEEPALVTGRVTGPGAANATVILWQRPAGVARATQLAQVSADGNGAFVFTRADAPLDETTTLYATALGQRSRSVREQVAASVTLSVPSPIVSSGSAVSLTGQVLPGGHAGEPLLLQQRLATGWATIDRVTLASGGGFSASPAFSGVRTVTVRAVFGGDARNLGNTSDPLDLLVESAQQHGLSLVASTNPLILGQSVTLSGTLAAAGGGGAPVTLLAGSDAADEVPVATTVSDGSGNFSFVQVPTANTEYRVSAGALSSAPVVVGVQQTVTLDASTLSAPLGATQDVQGTVTGASAGAAVALQLLGADGVFHSISLSHVGAVGGNGAAFSFAVALTDPGSNTYRVLAAGDAAHESGVSAPLTVVVGSRSAPLVAGALGQA